MHGTFELLSLGKASSHSTALSSCFPLYDFYHCMFFCVIILKVFFGLTCLFVSIFWLSFLAPIDAHIHAKYSPKSETPNTQGRNKLSVSILNYRSHQKISPALHGTLGWTPPLSHAHLRRNWRWALVHASLKTMKLIVVLLTLYPAMVTLISWGVSCRAAEMLMVERPWSELDWTADRDGNRLFAACCISAVGESFCVRAVGVCHTGHQSFCHWSVNEMMCKTEDSAS